MTQRGIALVRDAYREMRKGHSSVCRRIFISFFLFLLSGKCLYFTYHKNTFANVCVYGALYVINDTLKILIFFFDFEFQSVVVSRKEYANSRNDNISVLKYSNNNLKDISDRLRHSLRCQLKD